MSQKIARHRRGIWRSCAPSLRRIITVCRVYRGYRIPYPVAAREPRVRELKNGLDQNSTRMTRGTGGACDTYTARRRVFLDQ